MKNIDKLFGSQRSRAFLFFGALIAALILVAIFLDPNEIGPFPILPLLLFLQHDMWVLVAMPIAWIVYTIIILVGIQSPSLRTSKILFFVFVFLMLLSFLVVTLFELGVSLPCC